MIDPKMIEPKSLPPEVPHNLLKSEIKDSSEDKFDKDGNLKPPTVPLFQIPDAVLGSMSREASPDLSKFSNPVEWITAQRKFAEAQVQGPTEAPTMPPAIQATPSSVPVQPIPVKNQKRAVISWAGQDLDENALTMLFYLVVKEVSKDKKIKKVLKDMNIEIYDINDSLLWP